METTGKAPRKATKTKFFSQFMDDISGYFNSINTNTELEIYNSLSYVTTFLSKYTTNERSFISEKTCIEDGERICCDIILNYFTDFKILASIRNESDKICGSNIEPSFIKPNLLNAFDVNQPNYDILLITTRKDDSSDLRFSVTESGEEIEGKRCYLNEVKSKLNILSKRLASKIVGFIIVEIKEDTRLKTLPPYFEIKLICSRNRRQIKISDQTRLMLTSESSVNQRLIQDTSPSYPNIGVYLIMCFFNFCVLKKLECGFLYAVNKEAVYRFYEYFGFVNNFSSLSPEGSILFKTLKNTAPKQGSTLTFYFIDLPNILVQLRKPISKILEEKKRMKSGEESGIRVSKSDLEASVDEHQFDLEAVVDESQSDLKVAIDEPQSDLKVGGNKQIKKNKKTNKKNKKTNKKTKKKINKKYYKINGGSTPTPKTTPKTTPEMLDKPLYDVDIDFDDASTQWRKNKKSKCGNFTYCCGVEKKSGKYCKRSLKHRKYHGSTKKLL